MNIRDYKIKPLQQFYRPYFSPFPNSYEMDWMEVTNSESKTRQYFACINLNTKYLYILPQDIGVTYKLEVTLKCLQYIQDNLISKFGPRAKIKYLRADGAKEFGTLVTEAEKPTPFSQKIYTKPRITLGYNTFVSNPLTVWLKKEGISLSTFASPYTNKNRIIDRAIRTIRDRIGENADLFFDSRTVLRTVKEYNSSPHFAFNYEFSPVQVQSYPDLEECFIRDNLQRLEEVKRKQKITNYFKYQKNNFLLLHIDSSKLGYGGKNRRKFNRLGVFDYYENGNVSCHLLAWDNDDKLLMIKNPIVLPIYYTKFIAHEFSQVPNEYHKLILPLNLF
jgi:hypothetical protein